MGWLGRRCLRDAASAVAILLAVAAAAGLIRLLPWLLAPEVPLHVAVPFARALGASATETAFLIGLPLGFAWAAVGAVEHGEVRTMAALGVSPLRLVLLQSPHAVLAALVSVGAALGWGGSADVPGRFAAQLVAQGRQSCESAAKPRSALVPLVGVTWLCFPGAPPRVTGPLPKTDGAVWFSASSLEPSDDLREVALTDLRVTTRPDASRRQVDLRVRSGVVRGLPGWGRSPNLSAAARALLLSLTALLLSLGAVHMVCRAALRQRWQAILAGGLPAVGAFVLLHRLDASSSGPLTYVAVPALGAVVVPLMAAAARRVARAAPG